VTTDGSATNQIIDCSTALSGGGNALLAETGYQVFPSGLIVQWGKIATWGYGNGYITFPKPFPNQAFSVVVNAADDYQGAGDKQAEWGGKIFDKTKFRYFASFENFGGTVVLYWMATGW